MQARVASKRVSQASACRKQARAASKRVRQGDMKVSEQCGIAATNGNQIAGSLMRNIACKENELFVHLYKTVMPNLKYSIQAVHTQTHMFV